MPRPHQAGDLTNDTQITSHQQLLLPALYPAYFGPDLRLALALALHRITNNPRRTVEILL